MTTFEYIVLFFLFTIVVTIILRSYLIVQEVHNICKPYSRLDSKLQNINDTLNLLVDITDELRNAWACDVTSIVKRVNELTDVVDKMHKNLCVEIADKMVDRVYPSAYNPPCYAPNGICTNPQMDCINCPKRGTGGTWSTNISIKAEDAPLQKRFNEKKE